MRKLICAIFGHLIPDEPKALQRGDRALLTCSRCRERFLGPPE